MSRVKKNQMKKKERTEFYVAYSRILLDSNIFLKEYKKRCQQWMTEAGTVTEPNLIVDKNQGFVFFVNSFQFYYIFLLQLSN